MIAYSSSEVVQLAMFRLNDFIHLHIQKNGIAYVVDNYCPIREQYYENKMKQQQITDKENQYNV